MQNSYLDTILKIETEIENTSLINFKKNLTSKQNSKIKSSSPKKNVTKSTKDSGNSTKKKKNDDGVAWLK